VVGPGFELRQFGVDAGAGVLGGIFGHSIFLPGIILHWDQGLARLLPRAPHSAMLPAA
jgi:hypothetical protein